MDHRRPLLLLGVLVAAAGAAAQDPPVPPAPEPVQHPDEGKIIRRIEFKGTNSSERLTQVLKTRAGNPLRAAEVADDLRALWRTRKVIAVQVYTVDAEGGGVVVHFDVEEPSSYDRLVFKGLESFSEEQARSILGVAPGRRTSDIEKEEYARALERRYRRDGYYHARVTPKGDAETSTLTMVVDEGPKVTVREVNFRGNRSFPGDAPLDLYQNLIGSAELESKPAGKIQRGTIYSDEAVEADLDKLRIFYRRLGFRDARVELGERHFSQDQSQVDVTFRVIEGLRYRIRSVNVEHYTPELIPDPDPLYPKAMILEELVIKPGEYYDREKVNRDKRAIEDFYGKRGHPMSGKYGRRDIPDALRWAGPNYLQPVETFAEDSPEIDITYQIIEGTPKTLRDVQIEGNTDTQDSVVRRKVLIYPGDTLNIAEVDRSLQVLDSLRYFQDPESLQGVRFELRPVDNSTDEVDLGIMVQEGDTGSFLWGAGVSTGFGVQGRFQFNKRNFDLFRLPSSANPATIVSEIIESKAFHGAGQELTLFLAPGTELSSFEVRFEEPDLFGQHVDTIGSSISAYRRLRIFDSYDTDAKGVVTGLQRNFSENVQIGIQVRQETVDVDDIDPNAPTIVWDAEGSTELRTVKLQARLRELDNLINPAEGYDVLLYAEIAGGLLGAEEDFYKLGASISYYHLLRRDSLERPHVLFVRQMFDFGKGYDDTGDLFLTERFYMGGNNLRGFDQREAGPKQFNNPTGGEARYLSRVEYEFPMVSTRLPRSLREVELLRGVLFTDMGLLGTEITDPSFGELRLSVGAGLRIHVPYLGLPIALDFGIPLAYEQSDDRRVFYFSLSR